MITIVTKSMKKKQEEVTKGRFARPLNAYMDEVLTKID
jgi:hypothetical protein